MGIWNKNEYLGQKEQGLLQRLAALAQGYDPSTGARLTAAEQLAAVNQYTQLMDRINAAGLEAQRIESQAETERGRTASTEKVELERIASIERQAAQQLALEDERLTLEYEKLKLQKAELVIRAIEAVARAGPELANQLGQYVQDMSSHLLENPVLEIKKLEKKEIP